MRVATQLTDKQISGELKDLGDKWDSFRGECEGGAGSPGEWMIERMGELETEQKRRRAEKQRLARKRR